MNIRWVRVVLIALLLEVVLFATLVPLDFINRTLFLIAVPIGVLAFGYLISWRMLRTVPSPVVHGALVGIVATAMYLGLVLSQPGGFASGYDIYGVAMFWALQGLRIGACIAGAARNRPLPKAAGAA